MEGRPGFELDAERDAAHARVAVRVSELEQLPVGPGLAAGLSGLRGVSMDCATAIRTTALWTRLGAWVEAEKMVATTEAINGGELLPGADQLGVMRLIGEELAAISHLSYGTVMNQVGLVHQVGHTLPASWVALDQGQITLNHLKKLSEITTSCPPKVAELVDARVIPDAIRYGWTPYELGQHAGRVLLEIDPDGAAERAKNAKDTHDVRYYPGQDETATLHATGPATPTRRCMDTIEALADQLGRDGDDRPIGQRRTTAMQLLILGEPTHRPTVDAVLTLPLTSALGLTDLPGELSGHGPISAETARELLTDATLRRLLTDPITGIMIDLGRTRYRPTAPLDRIITHRDRTCRFPGCAKPAVKCDKDHSIPYSQGGCTSTDTLQALCRRHHNLKTNRSWHVDINPDGSTTWTSAAGFTSPNHPPATH